ncbi:hypothetical protein [Flavivirga aquatica]|uniref:hypothetical protein n=1 Tax=Flavivirga aquatica TaxID=1849968 RepID=UPI0013F4CC00|nr:hypothetical protein [Flavivirga aquatica]
MVIFLTFKYSAFNYPESGMTFIQGIRQVRDSDNVFITGSLSNQGQNNNLIYGLIL